MPVDCSAATAAAINRITRITNRSTFGHGGIADGRCSIGVGGGGIRTSGGKSGGGGGHHLRGGGGASFAGEHPGGHGSYKVAHLGRQDGLPVCLVPLWNGGGDGHVGGEEHGLQKHAAHHRRAPRQRHEVVPVVREVQRSSGDGRAVAIHQSAHQHLPRRPQLLVEINPAGRGDGGADGHLVAVGDLVHPHHGEPRPLQAVPPSADGLDGHHRPAVHPLLRCARQMRGLPQAARS
mmetsp:Transcript_12356/g.37195  ORF Transcript_12356/g.37195 Transcript_12356/m.37195 type:complete len:235 (+) Transcript_12356:704-1408(+)